VNLVLILAISVPPPCLSNLPRFPVSIFLDFRAVILFVRVGLVNGRLCNIVWKGMVQFRNFGSRERRLWICILAVLDPQCCGLEEGSSIIGVVSDVDDIHDSIRSGGFNETPGESTQPGGPDLLCLRCVTNNPLLWGNGRCDKVTLADTPSRWSLKL